MLSKTSEYGRYDEGLKKAQEIGEPYLFYTYNRQFSTYLEWVTPDGYVITGTSCYESSISCSTITKASGSTIPSHWLDWFKKHTGRHSYDAPAGSLPEGECITA